MRFDTTTPTIPEADLENVSKTDGVTLDLSKRSKIVIHAKTTREATTKRVTPGHSIFSRRLGKVAQKDGGQSRTPAKDVDFGQQPRATPKQSAMLNSPAGGPLERLVKEHEPMKRADDLREYVQPAQTTSPTIFDTKRQTPTKYAAECANCPCTFQGRPPCQRCRLLLLADRFCNLVDTQCEKWKSESRS